MRRALMPAGFIVVFLAGIMVGLLFGPRKAEVPTDVASAPLEAPSDERPSAPPDEPAPPADENRSGQKDSAPSDKPAQPAETPAQPKADSGGKVSLIPAKHHYGKVLEGEARDHMFRVARPAGTVLRLGRLYSPCPCIFVTAERREFPADKEAQVKVLVHSLTLEGKQSFPAYVEVIEPEKRVLRADVSIEVKRVPAKVMVKPHALHLGSVRGAKTTEVRLLNLTKRPLSLGKVKCSLKDVEVSLPMGSRVEPGRYAVVRLEVPEAGLPPGPIQGTVTIETNCPEHALVSIPVDGTALKPRRPRSNDRNGRF